LCRLRRFGLCTVCGSVAISSRVGAFWPAPRWLPLLSIRSLAMTWQEELDAEVAAVAAIDLQLERLNAEKKTRRLRIAALQSLMGAAYKAELKEAAAQKEMATEAARRRKRGPPTSTSSSDSSSTSEAEDNAGQAATKKEEEPEVKEEVKADPPVPTERGANVPAPAAVQASSSSSGGGSGPVVLASPPAVKGPRGKRAAAKEPRAKMTRHYYPPGVCHVCHAAEQGWPKVHGVQHLRTCPEASSRGGARR